MRSDREEIPEPFTKADADKAETMEARISTARLTAGCQVYWPSPYEVCGAIKDKYNSLGGPGSFLSFPFSAELTSPDGHGKFSKFLNGPIYWSAAGGAHPVVNSFLNRWGVHGYETGWLGYPTTDEIVHADGIGRRQEFQGGAIYVSIPNAVGSAVGGAIRDKWNTVGAETPGSLLGYPISDEIPLPDGQGKMNRFQRGVIYWHPSTGAYPVTDPILDTWGVRGYEQGSYGYPIGDATIVDGHPTQPFQFKTMQNQNYFPVSGGGGSQPPLYFEFDHSTTEIDYMDGQGMMQVGARLTWDPVTPSAHLPITWYNTFKQGAYDIAIMGNEKPMTCDGYLRRNGATDNYSYHKIPADGGRLDYYFHGFISQNSIDEELHWSMYCEFAGANGYTLESRTDMYMIIRDVYHTEERAVPPLQEEGASAKLEENQPIDASSNQN